MNTSLILIRPVITEKSIDNIKKSIFTFEVDRGANKAQIKNASEKLFNVHVEKVTTKITKGRKRRVGKKRIVIRTPDQKFAYIELKSGEKIDLFDVGGKTK